MQRFSRRNAIRMFAVLIASSAFATGSGSIAAEKAPLAIQGYDPVAYFTLGKPARGRADIEYEWDERRYRFLNARHRELFKADPVRYAPQFPNFCAVSLTRGEVVEANPENWLISDGKLYMFGKSIGPGVFKQDLAGNIARADQHRALIQKK